jgi:hypothetical protein
MVPNFATGAALTVTAASDELLGALDEVLPAAAEFVLAAAPQPASPIATRAAAGPSLRANTAFFSTSAS